MTVYFGTMDRFKTSRVPGNVCPACKHPMDAATSTDRPAKPKPDDVSVCFECGQVLLFNEDLTSRIPSQKEMIELQRSHLWPTLERIAVGVRKLRKLRSKP